MAEAAITGEMFVTETKVNTFSTYTMEMGITSTIPAGGSLEVKFFDNFSYVTGFEEDCQATYGFASDATCTYNEDEKSLTVTDAFPTEDFLLILDLPGAINPAYQASWFIEVTSYDASGQLLDESGASSFGFRTSPGVMSTGLINIAATSTQGSTVVGAYTDLVVSFTPSSLVEQTGSFRLRIPKWNFVTQTVGAEESMIRPDAGLAQCDLVGCRVPCSSSEHPQLACSFLVAAVATVEQIFTARDTLIISGFSRDIAADETFTFRTDDNSFRNPPTTRPISTFEASSHMSTGNMINEQTSNIVYQATTPATLPSYEVDIRAATGEINQMQAFDFIVRMPYPLPVGSVVELQVPLEVSFYSDDARTQLILTGATGSAPLYASPSLDVVDPQLQIVRISGIVPSANQVIDSGNPWKFGLLQLKNPGSIQETPEFAMRIYDENYQILDVDSSGLTYTATPGRLENLLIFPGNFKTRQEVPYEFSFETKNALFAQGDISIRIPEEIEVDPSSLQFTPLAGVSLVNPIFPVWDEDTRIISLNSAFDEALAAPSQVRFRFESGFTNSFSTDPITPIRVQTLDPQGEIIDEGNSDAIEFTANEINDIEATACADKQTASHTEEVCTYRLRFYVGSEFPILSGSTVEIELPDDLTIPDTAITVAQSYTDGLADLSSSFTVLEDGRTVEVFGAFTRASAPNGVDWRQDSFSVYVAGILTPRSTAPTLSFRATIKTSTGFVQYKKSQGVYSNVYQARNFKNVGIYRSSQANGDSSGRYIFSLQFSSVVKMNEYVKITPPPSITISPDADQCMGLANLSKTLSCTIADRSIYVRLVPEDVTIKTQWEAEEVVQIQIRAITNPLSFGLTDSFEVYVAEVITRDYFINQLLDGLSVTNNEAGRMTNVQLVPRAKDLGAVTDYAIYFTVANSLPMGSSVDITFPRDYYSADNLRAISCSAVSANVGAPQCAVPNESVLDPETGLLIDSSNVLRLTGAILNDIEPNSEVGFLLSGITNPAASLDAETIQGELGVKTISPAGYPIDESVEINFEIGCAAPCATCEDVRTQCLSCLRLDDGTPLFYLEAQKTCLTECPIGYRQNNFNVCEPCSIPCGSCSEELDKCESCDPQFGAPYVHITEDAGRCYSATQCPPGTYQSDATLSCEPCVGGCLTCLSPGECLSCSVGSYFMVGQCLSECPATSIKFDSETRNECEPCQEPCYTCEGTTDTCLTCISGFYFHEGQCVSSCPSGYKPDDFQTCYRASETILPFITMIAPVSFIIAAAISNRRERRTKPITAFVALQSSWLVGFWIYQLSFMLKDEHSSSALLIGIALILNVILNCIFYEFLKKRMLNGRDKSFDQYQQQYLRTSRTILNASMLTSFQLFRFVYCGMCGQRRYMALFENRMKYYKRINRYSLFQITMVYLPVFAASAYNLTYTWSGRQVFWIDVESMLVCVGMCVLHVFILLRTQNEYIKQVFDENEFGEAAKLSARSRDKYLVDPAARDLAKEIAMGGFKNSQHQKKLAGMSDDQREGTLRALFSRLFAKKQVEVDADGYKVKHGRGLDLNDKIFVDDDATGTQAYQAAGVAVDKGGYSSEMPKTKSKKMLYSSVGDEERRRAKEAEQDRANLEYQQFNGNDVTATMNDIDATPREDEQPGTGKNYQQIAQTTTQMDDNANPYEIGDRGLDFANKGADGQMHALRMKGDQSDGAFDGVVGAKRRLSEDSDAVYGVDKEIYNFSSAPQNANSALEKNRGLQQRYEQFQQELNAKGVRQAGMLKDGQLDQIEIEFARESRYDSMPFASKLLKTIEEDSDDVLGQFDSAQWGPGASKVIVQHYNSVQQKRNKNVDPNQKLSGEDFKSLIARMQECRGLKKHSKQQGAYIDIQRKELEVLVSAQRDEVDELETLRKNLQKQIDDAQRGLKDVEVQRKKDREFVEQAFYTSNEEGMGVSPNTYEGQNRMPRRGDNQGRDVKLTDPLAELGAGAVLPEQRIVKKRTEKPRDSVNAGNAVDEEKLDKLKRDARKNRKLNSSQQRTSAANDPPRGQAIREVGSAVLEGSAPGKSRKTSRKRKGQPVDYSGAYFQHTNFERAVIATNGRAPYNNKEVEMITKPEGFDPSSYHFRHNWVNNLMKSGKKSQSPGHHGYGTSAFAGSVDAQSVGKGDRERGSATVTAEFDALNSSNANQPAMADTHSKLQSNQMATPGKPVTNTLVRDSPMTLMELASDKQQPAEARRLSNTGDSIVHGTSHFGGSGGLAAVVAQQHQLQQLQQPGIPSQESSIDQGKVSAGGRPPKPERPSADFNQYADVSLSQQEEQESVANGGDMGDIAQNNNPNQVQDQQQRVGSNPTSTTAAAAVAHAVTNQESDGLL